MKTLKQKAEEYCKRLHIKTPWSCNENDAFMEGAKAVIEEMGGVERCLFRSMEKLTLYRKQHSGEYIGGMEYQSLIDKLDAELEKLKTLREEVG